MPPSSTRRCAQATRVTFDRLDSDGCMSTNDTVVLLASAESGVVPEPTQFAAAVTTLCADLAEQLQGDAEGASHDIRIEIVGAATDDDAVEVGRSIARNNLFKAAVFGNDPNWGRVLAAIGTTDAEFDPYDVDVSINGVRVCHAGAPDRPSDRGRPDAARGARARRSQGRPGRGDHPDQRPHARLRAREQRVLQLMGDQTTRSGLPHGLSDEHEMAAVKAATLIESLPWLKRFSGKVVVVKFGGNAMVDDALKRAFAEDMVYLRYAGLHPVVVHGGGPQISAALEGGRHRERVPRRVPLHVRPRRSPSSATCSPARSTARSSS